MSTQTELTPEVVLRAMLRAYRDAAEAERVSYYRSGMKSPRRLVSLKAGIEEIDIALAWLILSREPGELAFSTETMGPYTERDYEDRLAGERPIDAPPLEAP